MGYDFVFIWFLWKLLDELIFVIEFFSDDCVINILIKTIVKFNYFYFDGVKKEIYWDIDWRFWMLRFKYILVVLILNLFWYL